MTVTLSEKQLKILVRENVREVLKFELMKLRTASLPFVSKDEQREIERAYRKPGRRAIKFRRLEA